MVTAKPLGQLIIVIIIIEGSKSRGVDFTPNIFSLIHPLVQSRIRTLERAAPSQTEVTDLNCSDNSTNSKEMVMVVSSSIAVTPSSMVESDPESVSDGCAPKLEPRDHFF